MADCIFCSIAQGRIPAQIVYQDDAVVAFMDIAPISPGHTLVIPKQHVEKVHQAEPAVLADLAARLGVIARALIAAMGCEGYNVLCNNGHAAGQAVDHLHFHIIPRNSSDGVFDRWPVKEYATGQAEQIAKKIRDNLK